MAVLKKVFLQQRVDGKKVLIDVVRFFVFLVLFYGLVGAVVWGCGLIMLEGLKLDFSDILKEQKDTFAFDRYMDIFHHFGGSLGRYTFIMTMFCTFFSVPPKPLIHIVTTVFLISFITNITTIYDRPVLLALNTGFLFLYALLPWLAAHVWLKVKARKNGFQARRAPPS